MFASLDSVVSQPHRRLPRDFFLHGQRQTVAVGLIGQNNAFAVFSPKQDPSSRMTAQGPIGHNESVLYAAKLVLPAEIPSVQRTHQHAPPLVDWANAVYIGSALNPKARSGRNKEVHAVLARTSVHIPTLRVSETVGDKAQWVFSNEELEELLLPTRMANPIKADIIMAMAFQAHCLGWLE